MQAYHPDRVVRALTGLVSVAYYLLAAGTVLALVVVPAMRLLFPGDPKLVWSFTVPALASGVETAVRTRWGEAQLSLAAADADLLLPLGTLPWWLVAALSVHTAVLLVPPLLALHQLRQIFQRVRDGAPFDARNAVRLRTLGLLLLATALLQALAELVAALAVRPALAGDAIEVRTLPNVDLTLVFVALAVVALAEVFRRGAELEHEQALVV